MALFFANWRKRAIDRVKIYHLQVTVAKKMANQISH